MNKLCCFKNNVIDINSEAEENTKGFCIKYDEHIYEWLKNILNTQNIIQPTTLQIKLLYEMKTNNINNYDEFKNFIIKISNKFNKKLTISILDNDIIKINSIKTTNINSSNNSPTLFSSKNLITYPTPSPSNNNIDYKFNDIINYKSIYYYEFLNCIEKKFDYIPIIELFIKDECINDIIIKCIIGDNYIIYKKYINNIKYNKNLYFIIFYLCFYYHRLKYIKYIINDSIYDILYESLKIYLKNPYIYKRKSYKSFSFCKEDLLDSYIDNIKIKANNEEILLEYINKFDIDINFIILIYKNCRSNFFEKLIIYSLEKLLLNLNNNITEENYCKLFMENNLYLFNILNNTINLKYNLNLTNKLNLINKFLIYNNSNNNINIFLNILEPDISILSNSLLSYNINPNVFNYILVFNYYIKNHKILNLCYLLGRKLNINLNIVSIKNYKINTLNIENYDNNYDNNYDILKLLLNEINNLQFNNL